MKVYFVVSFAAASAMCSLAQSPQPQREPLATLQHIDVMQIDPSVSPCDNFYQYVCRKLNAANPIPPDQMFWGVAGELEAWNLQVLHQILEKNEDANISRTSNEQKIGDFYAECMVQARSRSDDLSAIQPLLASIRGMRDKRDIAKVLASIHSSFGRAWDRGDDQTSVAMFGYGPQADYNDVRQMVAGVDQGGLGMPSRAFYLRSDDETKAQRDKYVNLIIALLKMDGASEPDAVLEAPAILRVETALAQAQMDNVTRRDLKKTNNRYTLAQLKTLMPAFDWEGYLRGIGSPAVPLYQVLAPTFFRAMNKLLIDEDLATWKLYLRFHLLQSAAPTLGYAWRDASFTFERTLTGQQQQQPDWRRCTMAVDHDLGQALGQAYVAQVFPPESKARALRMVKDIEAAMRRDIDAVTWMQPATKREAYLKLDAVMEKIGYPDNWIDYSSLTIARESYPIDDERTTAFEFRRQLASIGKPIDRTQWGMTPATVNAYEDSQTNTINFPAGILQPVFFDTSADDVINYGAEGSVVGHELTHDFDDQGRRFDGKGNLRDWWTPEDAKEYNLRGACIAAEYTGAVPGVPGVQQNGELTQGEDTADNGGVHLALSALIEDLKRQGKLLEDKDAHGLTNLQRFFIAYGTVWCDQVRPEAARTLILTNPHSMPELRVNNVVSNMPEFQKAFGCRTGQPMVHATQCRVW